MTPLKVLGPWILLLLMSSQGLALDVNNPQQNRQALAFADSALECGIYYEYTAGGLGMNPNVDSEVVRTITQNSATLLHTAALLYDAAGVSIADRREAFMQRAKITIKEKQESPGSMDELIYAFGEKCKLLMDTYSYRIKSLGSPSGAI